MDAAQNARNLAAIRDAQSKQPPSAGAPIKSFPPATPKQQLLEIALHMVSMARTIPTPGVTDTYAHSRTLAEDAKTLMNIAEKM